MKHFPIIDAIFSAGNPQRILLRSGDDSLTAAQLRTRVGHLTAQIRKLRARCVALYADNGVDWIVADLACATAAVRVVPIPLFFSSGQIRHAFRQSGADIVLADRTIDPAIADTTGIAGSDEPLTGRLRMYRIHDACAALVPDATRKITFTSGTTGNPKGVCLSAEQQVRVAASLTGVIGIDAPTHLCILPLSTLLENLAGVYAPLMAGGTVIAPPLAEVGLSGSSQLNIDMLLEAIVRHRPASMIAVPEILSALTEAAECGWRPPSSLHFVAVGGAKVATALLRRARRAGLPAFEGYGLSECASVVALNVAGADRPGSVGRPLPHVRLLIEHGEIVITGNPCLGYAGQPESWNAASIYTGDIGHVDAGGFVYVDGRARNRIITSYGRNIAPEWVEGELLSGPLLRQAVVVGDARPWCAALLLTRDPDTPEAVVDAWIRSINLRLPDYARVIDWQHLPEPLAAANGTLTANGRPVRDAIERRYSTLIETLYDTGAEAGIQ
jgi:long-chain acyl-CoA synthetase